LPIYGLTAGLPSTLWPIVGSDRGLIHGLDHFGHSAPYKVLDEKLGFTPQLVAEEIKKFLGK
jgi:transketolase